jgi:hypothetical protein
MTRHSQNILKEEFSFKFCLKILKNLIILRAIVISCLRKHSEYAPKGKNSNISDNIREGIARKFKDNLKFIFVVEPMRLSRGLYGKTFYGSNCCCNSIS